MSATAGARPGPAWPAGLSHRAAYSISGVLEALQEQFPALTISKLRYLEDQGLLAPERTASGYRRYSEADIERLAWVLTQQRDHFLPLKVIRTRLAQLDAAPQPAAAPRPPRAVGSAAPAPPAASQPPAGDQALADAVAAAAGTGPQAGGAPAAAVAAVGELAAHGLDLRHLRPLFQA
ncbi:MAG: MerR family transcriptional regulator, partial [Bifidobacteriaceae bacterium]|nr:MerR family transcriptional regulator [Bifidobacteriaceae bacterium]